MLEETKWHQEVPSELLGVVKKGFAAVLAARVVVYVKHRGGIWWCLPFLLEEFRLKSGGLSHNQLNW